MTSPAREPRDPFDVDFDTCKNAPYWATGALPYKAATNEIIGERTLDSNLVQITEIHSVESVYVTPYPWADRDMMQVDLNKFYLSPEARTWTVNSTSLVKTGQVMVARWVDNQYYRVLIRNIVSDQIAAVLYIDYGSIDNNIDVTKLRLLHTQFTVLSAQAVEVRLWGVEEHQEDQRLQELLATYKGAGDQYACAVVTSANSGKVYRSHSGVIECVSKPAVILHKLHDPCSMMYDLLVTHNTAQLKLEDILENKDDKEELEYSDDEVESDISSAILNLLKPETVRVFRPRLISSVSIRVRSSAEIAAERERRTTTNISMIRVGALAVRRRVVIDVDDVDDDGELKLNNRVKVVRAKPKRRIDEDRNSDTSSSANRRCEVASVDDIDREGVSQVDSKECVSQVNKEQARSPYKIVKTCKFVKKA